MNPPSGPPTSSLPPLSHQPHPCRKPYWFPSYGLPYTPSPHRHPPTGPCCSRLVPPCFSSPFTLSSLRALNQKKKIAWFQVCKNSTHALRSPMVAFQWPLILNFLLYCLMLNINNGWRKLHPNFAAMGNRGDCHWQSSFPNSHEEFMRSLRWMRYENWKVRIGWSLGVEMGCGGARVKRVVQNENHGEWGTYSIYL